MTEGLGRLQAWWQYVQTGRISSPILVNSDLGLLDRLHRSAGC